MTKKLTLLIVLFLSISWTMLAQSSIKGKIVDDSNEPIAGAAILVKHNTKIGTFSDVDGNFELNVKEGTILNVSFIGFQTQEVKATKIMRIVLKSDSEALNSVVVTGYQKVKKERMTGSISTIDSKDIKNLAFKAMDQVLTGSIAGVSSLTSGRPGEDARIQIRGINSLTGSTEPIWIVDGMPLQGETPNLSATGGSLSPDMFQSGIGNISPDDIESITVLKDAAASAIYGARAANGVIVVTTKSGHEGRTNINVTTNFTVRERPRNNIDMMNSKEKIQFEREIYDDLGIYTAGRIGTLLRKRDYGVISPEEAEEQIHKLEGINTDWFKELYHPAFSSQANVSMSGGTRDTQFYTSLNYLDEKGIEMNNRYNRMRFNSKISHNLTKTLRVETDLSATYRTNRQSGSSISSLSYALYANPYEQPGVPDESYSISYSRIRPGLSWPYLDAKKDIEDNTRTSRYLEGSLRAALKWKPVKGLELISQGIYSASNNTSRDVQEQNTYTNFYSNWLNSMVYELALEDVKGSLRESSSYSNSYTWRNTAEYNLELNNKHYINLFAGQEVSATKNYVSFNYSPQFDSMHRIIGFPDLPKGIDTKKIPFTRLGGTGKFESKLVSFFLSGTYSYDDIYVLSGSVRYDGSDIIGNKNQFTPLWNVSGKWNIDKESFFNVDFINTLALKAGFGYTGSIDKNALPFVLMTLDENIDYANLKIPTSFTYSNPNIKWQTKRDFNIGLESSFFNRSIWLDINYYNNKVFNLLDRRSLPLSSGRASVVQNVADVVNRGWEFDVGADLIRRSSFVWTIKGNVAINDNVIKRTFYKGLEDLPKIGSDGGKSFFVEGYPVSSWYGYKFAEVDKYSGNTMVYGDDDKLFNMDRLQNVTLGLKPPKAKYLGQFIPPVIGGFSTSVTWNRFVFNMNFEFRAGNYIKSFNTFRPLSSTNRFVGDKNRWRAPGDVADIPVISYSNQAYQNYMYDKVLEKGDYLRNTYTSLGYNLDTKFAKALGIQYARITLSAMNLFTLTKYSGIDPTLMGSIGYPNTRSYTLTLNVGF